MWGERREMPIRKERECPARKASTCRCARDRRGAPLPAWGTTRTGSRARACGGATRWRKTPRDREADESFLGLGVEEGPTPCMLFRPEEVHPRSEKRRTPARRSEAVIEMAHHPRWIHRHELPVAYLEDHGVAAVETRRLHLDRCPREEPSHGGRLEAALREPFLLPAHRHAVLGGQIVERRE